MEARRVLFRLPLPAGQELPSTNQNTDGNVIAQELSATRETFRSVVKHAQCPLQGQHHADDGLRGSIRSFPPPRGCTCGLSFLWDGRGSRDVFGMPTGVSNRWGLSRYEIQEADAVTATRSEERRLPKACEKRWTAPELLSPAALCPRSLARVIRVSAHVSYLCTSKGLSSGRIRIFQRYGTEEGMEAVASRIAAEHPSRSDFTVHSNVGLLGLLFPESRVSEVSRVGG